MQTVFTPNKPSILVVDDFLVDAIEIRQMALREKFVADERFYKGFRSKSVLMPYVKEKFEELLGQKIKGWQTGDAANGVFQYTTKADQLVYHSDPQRYAGAIYLNPMPPANTGTSFWRSLVTGHRSPPDDPAMCERMYGENVLKPEAWVLTDKVENVFGRLVLWRGNLVHSASGYFGEDAETGRLVWLFFFDTV